MIPSQHCGEAYQNGIKKWEDVPARRSMHTRMKKARKHDVEFMSLFSLQSSLDSQTITGSTTHWFSFLRISAILACCCNLKHLSSSPACSFARASQILPYSSQSQSVLPETGKNRSLGLNLGFRAQDNSKLINQACNTTHEKT